MTHPHSDTQDAGKSLLDGTSHPARAVVDAETTQSRIVWPELADAIRNGTFRAWLADEEITHWFRTDDCTVTVRVEDAPKLREVAHRERRFRRADEASAPQRDPDVCPRPGRVDGDGHSWKFDGDNPIIVCHFCHETRDAISGVVFP